MVKKGMTPQKAQEIRKAKGMTETKLQGLRVKKGLSQNELSIITGIARRTVQSYENRTRPIEGASLERLCDLAIALDCKIEDILDDKTLIDKYRIVK